MSFDTIIRNGTVVTASDTFRCDVGIRNGRITALADNLDDALEIIDASGLYVMPGGIDSHVHLAQPSGDGIVMADDFASGTLSAAFGGNTTVMPFCLQEKGSTLREALKAYHAKAEGECYVDVSFHIIVTDPTGHVLGQELPALVADGYTSIKVFMTYENLRLRDDELLATLDSARTSRALVMVHCENEDAIRFLIGRHEANGELAPKYHATSRPFRNFPTLRHASFSTGRLNLSHQCFEVFYLFIRRLVPRETEEIRTQKMQSHFAVVAHAKREVADLHEVENAGPNKGLILGISVAQEHECHSINTLIVCLIDDVAHRRIHLPPGPDGGIKARTEEIRIHPAFENVAYGLGDCRCRAKRPLNDRTGVFAQPVLDEFAVQFLQVGKEPVEARPRHGERLGQNLDLHIGDTLSDECLDSCHDPGLTRHAASCLSGSRWPCH